MLLPIKGELGLVIRLSLFLPIKTHTRALTTNIHGVVDINQTPSQGGSGKGLHNHA